MRQLQCIDFALLLKNEMKLDFITASPLLTSYSTQAHNPKDLLEYFL